MTRFDIRWRKNSPYGYCRTLTRSVQIWHAGDLFHPRQCVDRRLTVAAAIAAIRKLEKEGPLYAS